MDFEKEEIDNLSETMSESSDEKPEKYVDSDDENESEAEAEDIEDVDPDMDEAEVNMETTIFNKGDTEIETSSDEDDDEDEDDEIFDKIDHSRDSIIQNHHPELKTLNYEEIETLYVVVRDNKGIIIDPLHKTLPILSRYEKARILGERAEQINSGAQPFIEIETSMIDGYLIAMKELEQKKIPFIIQRPLPNGGCEYWRLSDLEIIS
jgi:DNA-directed RNA polymerase I, II, and III subunit RPABC2